MKCISKKSTLTVSVILLIVVLGVSLKVYLKPDMLEGKPAASKNITADVWDGKIPGTKFWLVPSTPNGLNPTQCWFSMTTLENGDMYFGASDHITNSALYRITKSDDKINYLGDACSASKEVNNWLNGETAEKFHNKPILYDGKLYVATTDYSNLDEKYLSKRGFKWYAYDLAKNKFYDLSVKEPKGISGEHASIMSTAIDEKNGYIYGISSPLSEIYRYDIKNGVTENLGRAPYFNKAYYNASRFMWVDSNGRLYFTLDDFPYILYYDPKTGYGENKNWSLDVNKGYSRMIRSGQWSLDGKHLYISDYRANFYMFNDEDKSFKFLGKAVSDAGHYQNGIGFRIRSMNVTADEKNIYFINDDSSKFSLFEFNIESGKTDRICYLSQIDDIFNGTKFYNHAGHGTWDSKGRFYISSFGNELVNSTELIVTRIDPVQLKVHLGLLKKTEINISLDNENLILNRTGEKGKNIEVVLEVKNNLTKQKAYGKILMPSNSETVKAVISSVLPKDFKNAKDITVSVVANGDIYTVGTNKRSQ